MTTFHTTGCESTVGFVLGDASQEAMRALRGKGHANDKRRSCVVPISEGEGLVRVHFVPLPSESPDAFSYADEEYDGLDYDLC